MDTNLQREPVYQQLNDRLRVALGDDYRHGDKFLTEREISEKFDVSRATANKAVAGLVSQGLLEFRRGIGTFVRRDKINYDVGSLISFTEKAKTAGKKPSTQLVAFEKVTGESVDKKILESLELQPKSDLWEMKRIRMADTVPVILEHRFVVADRCPKLTRAQAKGSLYKAFTQTHGLTVAGSDEIIRAVLLKASEADQLQIGTRSAALEIVSVGFLNDDSPLWWERTLYRADQYEFHSRLGPIQSAPPRGMLR